MADPILSGLDGETVVSDPVKKARTCAIKEHGKQMYGDQPYIAHLDAVHDLLVGYGVQEEAVRVAAYLHDILEDTEYPFWKLLTEHGFAASEVVIFCTDEKGPSRRVRKQLTYDRIREFLDKKREGSRETIIRCVLVKLADRVSNIRNCVANNPRLLDMYLKEKKAFKDALLLSPSKSTPQLDLMWAEYDRLLG